MQKGFWTQTWFTVTVINKPRMQDTLISYNLSSPGGASVEAGVAALINTLGRRVLIHNFYRSC